MKLIQKILDKFMFKKRRISKYKKEADAIYRLYWNIGEYELAESNYKAYMDMAKHLEES